MIRYYKLFDLLNRRGMKKSDLRAIISSATVAKLSKGEYISGEAVDKICLFLGCQPGDIMEVVKVVEEFDENTRELVIPHDDTAEAWPEPRDENVIEHKVGGLSYEEAYEMSVDENFPLRQESFIPE